MRGSPRAPGEAEAAERSDTNRIGTMTLASLLLNRQSSSASRRDSATSAGGPDLGGAIVGAAGPAASEPELGHNVDIAPSVKSRKGEPGRFLIARRRRTVQGMYQGAPSGAPLGEDRTSTHRRP